MIGMTSKRASILAAATFAAAVPTITSAPSASAEPCPDVQVIFARGTTEPAGLGSVGGPFVKDLKAKVAPQSVIGTAVDYPATNDFGNSVPAGTSAARALIESTAANCPNTKLVLGGFSQGAAVVQLAANEATPQSGDHVAASALFGAPRSSFSSMLASGQALPSLAPQYAANAIDQCNVGDPICWEGGMDMGAHVRYVQSGKVAQAADFVAARV